MQCTWQRLARLAFQGVARPPPLYIRPFPALTRKPLDPWGHTHPRLFTTAQRMASRRWFKQPKEPPLPVLSGPSTTLPLSSAQLGRAASSAIRFSLQQGNISDAYHIVNSVRYAGVLHGASSLPGIPSMERFRSLALAFPSDVSPRLPSHTLLHGLIRVGMLDKASSLAEQMMAAGITVRGRTLEAIYLGLAQKSTEVKRKPQRAISPSAFMLESSDILLLRPSMTRDTGTRFALRLLNLARQSRQRRTHTMFKTLMALCIINGEIIVGSLLFGILLRDWQARELQRISENSSTPSTHETPLPVRNRMKEICSYVDESLAIDRKDDQSQLEFKSSLQALANLAHYLDRRLIPFDNITPILCSLYNCPRTPDKVWIPDKDGTPQQVEAYMYFHDVLQRLIHSLPNRRPTWRPSEEDMMPLLDPASCATLLHYSLRHRRTVALAEKVLHHMTKLRDPPIKPNITTINIIERSWKLLSESEIAKEVVAQFQESSNPIKDQSDMHSPSKESALSRGSRELVDIAKTGDNYALSTRMTTLISTGQPQVVVNAIPFLLPGLLRSSYPKERDGISSEKLSELRTKQRKEGLRHAVSLGPVVLTSILNALQKTAKTGIAEKVWLWAKDAEALSWRASEDGRAKPWCLPVLAYTVMIKVYAIEAKKGWPSSLGHGHRKLSVHGWGRRRKVKNQKIRHPKSPQVKKTRSQLGRELGLEVYRSMWSAVENIEKMLSGLRRAGHTVTIGKRQLEIPRPDARFFNAILDIVGRQQGMSPRRLRRSPTHYIRLVRRARARFIRSGILPYRSNPDPALVQVAKDMIAQGFSIPLIYQRLLIGKLGEAVEPNVSRKVERDQRPFALAVGNFSSGRPNGLEEVRKAKLLVVDTRSFHGVSKRRTKKRQGKKKDGMHYLGSAYKKY